MFDNGESLWSFITIIVCIAFTVLAFLWMHFCYFPGGYKRSEVMDMGEYAMIVAAQRLNKLEDKSKEGQPEDADELYYERNPGEMDGEGGGDWQSQADADVEQPGEYYEEEETPRYDPSVTTPSSQPSAGDRDTASYRDDRSDSTYAASTPHSGGYYY
ncbi:hypothetical protein CLOP_g161 [Closterium sp. NIES-67]|nr:hypothetical protein CLOP_g161 [Closterium sp. NIES-67]